MGIPTNIKTLLSGDVVEWARIEFKETWDAEASLKTICAFANDMDNWGGGYLVIGVRDAHGQPDSLPGVNSDKVDGYLKDMLNKCKRIQPEYMPMDFADLCRNMNLVSSLPEYVKPKNVGLMFFSLEPEKFFPYAQIDVVQFPDDLGGDQIIEKTFTGPLHQQLRETLQYIRNSIITERIHKLPDKAEANRYFNYPYAAIEEAISNAVYHKGYDIREPIEVRVLPDRIEILSHPGADRSISMDGLKNYRAVSRRYRNRRIGEFLKELHLTEGRNTGFQKIIRALKTNGSPMPVFETDNDRTYFLTTIPIHPDFLIPYEDRNEYRNEYRNDAVTVELTEHERLVLGAIHQNATTTIRDMVTCLGISKSSVSRALKGLQEKQVIERIGSTKKGIWKTVK